ncbi:hypothetical protein MPER_10971 [Moniliophthora perniciosa FA553]|nr:hypothetical protein MPER_10971 [Moniliophthora perniciosa FA553]
MANDITSISSPTEPDKQFIFAATVIKYIDTDDELPQDRLGTILRIYVERESGSPYSDLDLLYHQVLSTCRRWEKVQAVLRLLVTPPDKPSYVQYSDNISWRSSEMVALLLNLRKGEVETILSRLHSVLQIPESGGRDNIRIAHASFTEFLSDANRSGEYHTPKMSHSEYFDCVAVLLLRTLSTPKQHYPPRQSEPDLTKTLSVWKDMVQKTWGDLMNYSFSNWYRYCKVVQSPSLDLLAAIGEFDPYLFMAAYAFHGIIMNLDIWRDIFVWAKVRLLSASYYV